MGHAGLGREPCRFWKEVMRNYVLPSLFLWQVFSTSARDCPALKKAGVSTPPDQGNGADRFRAASGLSGEFTGSGMIGLPPISLAEPPSPFRPDFGVTSPFEQGSSARGGIGLRDSRQVLCHDRLCPHRLRRSPLLSSAGSLERPSWPGPPGYRAKQQIKQGSRRSDVAWI